MSATEPSVLCAGVVHSSRMGVTILVGAGGVTTAGALGVMVTCEHPLKVERMRHTNSAQHMRLIGRPNFRLRKNSSLMLVVLGLLLSEEEVDPAGALNTRVGVELVGDYLALRRVLRYAVVLRYAGTRDDGYVGRAALTRAVRIDSCGRERYAELGDVTVVELLVADQHALCSDDKRFETLDALQAGALQVGAPQVGAPQVGALQVGALQVGALQVGALQVGALQVGAPQVGAPQVGALQVGALQVGALQFGALQVGAPQVGALQVGALQFG